MLLNMLDFQPTE